MFHNIQTERQGNGSAKRETIVVLIQMPGKISLLYKPFRIPTNPAGPTYYLAKSSIRL